MDLTQYAALARRTRNPALTPADDLTNAAMGLAGEAAESLEIVKKYRYQGHALDRAKLSAEIGDTCWYLVYLIEVLGLDLGEVLTANIAKLRERYPEQFTAAASVQRIDQGGV